jgi:hypothetical protein
MGALEQAPFTWGAVAGTGDIEETRWRYLAALRAADSGDFGPLEDFVAT